ncbi:MAG: hypothetical protein AVDCRST_MAG23-61, partial [uncultured Sphingosinicella sp.]
WPTTSSASRPRPIPQAAQRAAWAAEARAVRGRAIRWRTFPTRPCARWRSAATVRVTPERGITA